MEVHVHYDNPGAAVFAQFDDADDTRVAFDEGTGLKAGRFSLTDTAIIDSGLSFGSFVPTVRIGDIDDLEVLGDIRSVFQLQWNGESVVNQNSGGGILSARIGAVSLTSNDFLEVVQGEEKTITFIVEAHGRFDQASFDTITVKIKDSGGTVVTKEEDDYTTEIERVCEAFDVQVIRCTLSEDDTASLVAGLMQIEIAFDSQKARLSHSLKILDQIESEGS